MAERIAVPVLTLPHREKRALDPRDRGDEDAALLDLHLDVLCIHPDARAITLILFFSSTLSRLSDIQYPMKLPTH